MGNASRAAVAVLLVVGGARCSADAPSDDAPANDIPQKSDGSAGDSIANTGIGGAAGVGGTMANGGAGNVFAGARDGSTAGSQIVGHDASVGQDVSSTPGVWIDVSPPSSNKKVSGVVVNRLTGDVFADANDGGVWKSTNQGGSWARVDGSTVGGLVVTGPGFDIDQNAPTRMAAWSLDGTAGWTSDGASWQKMAALGRNWDFGATDWATPIPKTMFASLHESSGAVYLSTNGAVSWTKLSVIVLASGAGFPPPAFAMVGVMDATTLIYGNGDGIYRSTDTGATFVKVSPLNAQTRVPVLFKGSFYLGGAIGLMVSKDKGATWTALGSAQSMWVGPFFGTDEMSMVSADSKGIYKTVDGAMKWTKIASLPTDTKYDPRIWGGCAWDPIANIVYVAATGLPLLKMQL